jgi:hypothetical protein
MNRCHLNPTHRGLRRGVCVGLSSLELFLSVIGVDSCGLLVSASDSSSELIDFGVFGVVVVFVVFLAAPWMISQKAWV